MNLDQWEKERMKAYNQYLKEEASKQNQFKKEMDSYQRKKELFHQNQLVGKLDQEDARRLNLRKNTALLLQQQNSQMSQLKKNSSRVQETNSPIKNPSFNEQINQNDVVRLSKLKQELKNQYHHNSQKQHEKKKQNNSYKQAQKQSEIKHMDRVKEMDDESKNYYNYLLKKHQQNMNLYQRHSQLTYENDEYKKYMEKFTDTHKDIFHHIWRNQTQQRKKANIQTQELLKKQIDEFNQKKSVEKSHIQQGDDLDRSIFRSVHRIDKPNKQLYSDNLKFQMEEVSQRKSEEKKNYKQKQLIDGVFGGHHDRQRSHQIKIIDRTMGIAPKINLSMELERNQSPKKYTNNEEENKNQIKYKPKQPEEKKQEPMMEEKKSQSMMPKRPINYSELNPFSQNQLPKSHYDLARRNKYFH